jgi:hypothetical protein
LYWFNIWPVKRGKQWNVDGKEYKRIRKIRMVEGGRKYRQTKRIAKIGRREQRKEEDACD